MPDEKKETEELIIGKLPVNDRRAPMDQDTFPPRKEKITTPIIDTLPPPDTEPE